MTELDKLVIVLLFMVTNITTVLISYVHKEDTAQCWTNTVPTKTTTWHQIKCPKGMK